MVSGWLSFLLISVFLSNDIILFSQIYLFSNLINFTIATYVVCKIIGYNFLSYFFVNLPIMIASLGMFFILILMNNILSYSFFGFVFKIFLGISSFLFILFIYSNKYIDEIFKWVINRVHKGVRN